MFVVSVIFDVEPQHADQFLVRVRQQAQDSLDFEPACHRFDVCIDPQRLGRIYLYEIYTDRDAFDEHLASDHFKAFDAEVGPITMDKQVDIWQLVS